jgi:hypothetical protein
MNFNIVASLFFRCSIRPAFTKLVAAGVVISLVSISGCSISASSNGISDSISSPFKWSSDSSNSSSDDKKEAYLGDVRDYTVAYLRSSNDIEAFRRGLASLATKHGITNWEADQASYSGIGEGFGKAQVSVNQAEIYKKDLSGGDAVKAAVIQKGYEKYRKTA